MQRELELDQLTTADVTELLKENDMLCEMKSQPDFPVLELRIDGQSYVFNSLYRVWMIESIFSNVLEEKYKIENEADSSSLTTEDKTNAEREMWVARASSR